MNLLYLVHRLPFPPHKGDKVRSYHLLKHLASTHRVFLGTFVDDADDEQYVPTVEKWCADACFIRLNPKLSTLRSVTGFLTGEALGLRYYRSSQMKRWVEKTIEEKNIDAIVVFSSVMAQFLEHLPTPKIPPVLTDFVDVDSSKWTQYAQNRRGPVSWVYAREGVKLLAYEKNVAEKSFISIFATENEAELFRKLAPESAKSVMAVDNGVDADFYSPSDAFVSPYPARVTDSNSRVVAFTGAMDYWPNVDAVCWFVNEMMPRLRLQSPGIRFFIVGSKPAPAVAALATNDVVVTGAVDDVRPYFQYADVIVAPLRVARGIQKKVLEETAMSRPVVASKSCLSVIPATDPIDFIGAETPDEFMAAIFSVLSNVRRAAAIGAHARKTVLAQYGWEAQLSKIDLQLQKAVRP